MNVGIRELKAKLSEYVQRAGAGEMVIITDRGRPVAQLSGLSGGDLVERGIAEGWIEPPRRRQLSEPVFHEARESVASVLDDDRG